jgi:SAM-dependent methyltransferase
MNYAKINVSEPLVEAISIFAKIHADSTDKHMENHYINHYLNIEIYFNRMKYLLSLLDFEINSVLEIGSGIGTSCIAIKSLTDANVTGLEPANNTYAPLTRCINEFKKSNPHLPYEILSHAGENIPMPDESFDFIYSLEVMEHVTDPEKVISEVYRLLVKGGVGYIATSNYDSFYEGHYKRFWDPFVNPEINKQRYIKAGLSPKFFDEINFITKRNLYSYCKKYGFREFIFNPIPCRPQLETKLKIILPESFHLSEIGRNIKPTNLHKFIEKPFPSKVLSFFDREYKLYLLLRK